MTTQHPWEKPPTPVLLLGTFHFQDGGHDRHKPDHDFVVFSERRQQEIANVVERLAKFQPTKIAIERNLQHQAQTDEQYAAYRRGAWQLEANEVNQLGYRLAKQLGHARVYCVNAWDRYYDPPVDLELYLQTHTFQETNALVAPHMPDVYARAHDQEHLLNEWWPFYEKQFAEGDKAMATQTLREMYLQSNTEEALLRSHGIYLTDGFKVGLGHDYPGPDKVTTWYNRNLRIFANLQRITTEPDERILVIFGAGHVPVLRHCVQASPEYALVEVADVLG